jgi:hypothetical protein
MNDIQLEKPSGDNNLPMSGFIEVGIGAGSTYHLTFHRIPPPVRFPLPE